MAFGRMCRFLHLKINNMDTYTLSQAAGILGIENIGRQKIYRILKELGIVEKSNRPVQKYINGGYFALGMPTIMSYGHDIYPPVTYVVGQRGLNFLLKILTQYLSQNPVPTISRRKRFRGTDI